MKDWCVRCDKKREGSIDDDPETGTGNFICNKCWGMYQKSLEYEDKQEYEAFRKLDPEQKAEIRSEYAMAGVDFPY